ncbi:uncharacterized protein [Mytilus edulis]|uniref:uncharacterized protein n=1 Tax=Mytilus edulis TaxID=6550 RepID=UPI0039F0BF7D
MAKMSTPRNFTQPCEYALRKPYSHPENQNVPERGKKTKSIAEGRPLDIVGVQKIREQWGIIVPVNTKKKSFPILDFITSSHIIKDLPFGERHLKLSSGEVMDAPNIIRCMGPATIIQQYQAYCEENEISLLGSSTMFKILSECSATVRKSLEGLDYFVAEGSRGFQDLQDIVLSEGYPEASNGTELNRLLLEAKHYMKTDYKVHYSIMTF